MSSTRIPKALFPMVAMALLVLGAAAVAAQPLDEHCVISALNRTARVPADGAWVLPYVPTNLGSLRVRATCVEDGVTRAGQSDFILVPANGVIEVPEIFFDDPQPIPTRLQVTAPVTALTAAGQTVQLAVSGVFSDGSQSDLTSAILGTSYSLSNPRVATVSADGLVTALASGTVLVGAANDGALGLIGLTVVTSGDADGDGLPDDFEVANGLDPNDPLDALDDPDGDGLSTLAEFQRGLDPRNPDTDGDGLLDGEEDSFGTDPLLFDTDGDGLSDGLEIQLGSNPLDPEDYDLAAALTGISVQPAAFNLVFNTVLGEASTQLRVSGSLVDGTSLDLTATNRGTQYSSSDLTVCSFGLEPGRVFAGANGPCTITITNNGFATTSAGVVSSFSPRPLSALAIPGAALGVAVVEDLAYVAAGGTGIVVVDVSNRSAPVIVGTVDTPGTARDLVAAGGLLYVADGGSGLRIFDLSNPVAPALLGAFDTPGDAQDLEIRGGLVFLADGNQGLSIVDVSAPAAPALVGSAGAFGSLGTFAGIGVDDARALAVAAAGSSGLRVFDVSNPASPRLLGSASYGGNAQAVVLGDGFAHVADSSRSLTTVDLTDPARPVVGVSTPAATGGLLRDAVRSGDLVFGADFFFVNGVPIVNVGFPANPIPVAILNFSTFGSDNGTSLAVDGQYVYYTTSASRLLIGQYLEILDNDGIAPTVALTAPAAGETPIGGTTLAVTADAFDDVAVARVDFLADGEVVFRDFSKPYGFTFAVPVDTATVTLGARAVDYGNNTGSAEDLVLTVVPDEEPPVFSSVSPADGTPFTSGDALQLAATVTDDVRVTRVTFEVGDRVFTDTAAPFEQLVSTPPVFASTDLAVRFTAEDPSGNLATVEIVVPVEPLEDLAPPVARILTPGDGDSVLAGSTLAVALELEDDTFLDAYTLTLTGPFGTEVIGARAFIEQPFFSDEVALEIPAGANPGQLFTLRLETSDFGGNSVAVETTVEVIDGSGVLTGDQTLDAGVNGQDLLLGAGTFTAAEPLDVASLVMLDGARLTAAGGTLSLQVAGRLQVGGGAEIFMDGKGYPGGTSSGTSGGAPAGVAGAAQDAGGSHGGTGVVFDGPGPAGAVYDSVYLPHLAGGGGARDQDGSASGHAGGGIIDLQVGQLSLNGAMRARGLGDRNRAGGAGGTVFVDAGSIAGTGIIDVSGGSTSAVFSSERVGAGGGGRIALYGDDLSASLGLRLRAEGGVQTDTNGAVNRYAAPGTIYLFDAGTDTWGHLLVDSGETSTGVDRRGPVTDLPALGNGVAETLTAAGPDALLGAATPFATEWLGAFARLRDAAGTALGTFRVLDVDPDGNLLLEGAGGVAGAATYEGVYRFDRVLIANGAGLNTADALEGGLLEATAGAARLPVAFEFSDVVLRSGVTAIPAAGGEIHGRAIGVWSIETGAVLDVSGRGFAGGTSSGTSGSAPAGIAGSAQDAGGSHGGTGVTFDGAGPAGEVYDSVYLPQLAGGGGARDQDGASNGQTGGGVLHLEAATLVLDGQMWARGLGDRDRAGGAGGTVLIEVGVLTGGGLIDASGGSTSAVFSSERVGAGGGGRVALHAGQLQGFDPVTQTRALGGVQTDTNGAVNRYAAPGTVFVFDASSAVYGDLLIDSGETAGGADRRGPVTRLPVLGAGAVTTLTDEGGDAWLAASGPLPVRWLGARVRLLDAADGELLESRVLARDEAGRLLLEGAAGQATAVRYEGLYRFDDVLLLNGAGLGQDDALEGGDLEIGAGAARLPVAFRFANLTLKDGALVTPATGGTIRGRVDGTLRLETGAILDTSGLGYAGGTNSGTTGEAPAGITGSAQDAGGSHGGTGVTFDGAGPAGEVYDSVYLPQLAGGGGARDQDGFNSGHSGGGVIDLTVGILDLDGEIRAKGLGGRDRAAGAGGTVLVDATTVRGLGLIDASGGSTSAVFSSERVGAGGGGRIALYAEDLDGFNAVAQTRVLGGVQTDTNGAVHRYAAPGTVYTFVRGTATYGDLLVDAGESGGQDRRGPVTSLPFLGEGTASLAAEGADAWLVGPDAFRQRWVGAHVRLFDTATGDELGVFPVLALDDIGRLRLGGAGATAGSTATATFEGVYRFDNIDLLNAAGLGSATPLEAGDLEIGAGAARLPVAFDLATLTLREGAIVTPASGGTIRGRVSDTLTVETGARLDVSSLGYTGGTSSNTTGGAPAGIAGSAQDAGGSHGGLGVVFDGNGPAGEVYDSVYVPQLAGGGGARDQDGSDVGGPGGGIVDLTVGALVLDGEIRARGFGDRNRAGGAGGTVLVAADAVRGSGLIDASGGSTSAVFSSERVGAAGGGRIALWAGDLSLFDPVTQTRVQGGVQTDTNGAVHRYAAPGTVYVYRNGVSVHGSLLIDNGETGTGGDRVGPATPLPTLGSGTVTQLEASGADAWLSGDSIFRDRWLGAFVELLDAGGGDLGLFRVLALDGDQRLLLEGAAPSVGLAAAFSGKYRFDDVDLRNGAGVVTEDELIGMDVEVLEGDAELPPVLFADNLTLRAGAVARPAVGDRLEIHVSGTLTIEAGARLEVSGLGFAGGDNTDTRGRAPAGITGAAQDAGGSHGGTGVTFDGAGPAGEVYDSVYFPRLAGGGGARDQDGSDVGQRGAGVIEIYAGRVVLDGEIRARGFGGRDRAAGAGGTVFLDTDVLEGTGLIDASGGSTSAVFSNERVGAAGGGRIALHADQLLGFDVVAQTRAQGGVQTNTNGAVHRYAAPGTVYLRRADSTFGELLVDSGEDASGNDRRGPSTLLPVLGDGAVAALEGAGGDAWLTAAAPFQERWLGVQVRLQDAAGDPLGSFEATAIDDAGRLLLAGAGAVIGAATYDGGYRFDRVELLHGAGLDTDDELETGETVIGAGGARLPARIATADLTFETGSVATPARGGSLALTASGTVRIEAGARIDVTGLGFAGGDSGDTQGRAPAGVAGSAQDAGGSHGGAGVRADGSGAAGEVYDSVYAPHLAGGGGARDQDGSDVGHPGGGLVDLSAAAVILDGEIRAWGGGGASGTVNRAGGAGGTVVIEADTLSGGGLVDASGGWSRATFSSERAGVGGGGRIALLVDQLIGFDPATQTRVRGGGRIETNGALVGYAAPGTVFVFDGAAVAGDLHVDQGGTGGLGLPRTILPTTGAGVVGLTEIDPSDPTDLWVEPQDPLQLFSLGVEGMALRVGGVDYPILAGSADRRRLLLDGAAGLIDPGDAFAGVYRFDTVHVRGGATLEFLDLPLVDTFDVDPDSAVITP